MEKKKPAKRKGKSEEKYECESCGNTSQDKEECCGEPMKKKEQ